uniref:RING-type domain-containing protein n=1 Tax=Ditylenchus dipsaci TaxID=166011 RepID=A0A915DEL1_9BILA
MVPVVKEKSLEIIDQINLVGVRDFIVIKDSIKSVLGDGCITTIFLGFAKLKNKLPRFAFSSVSPKKLFWMLSDSSTKISSLSAVKIHKWCPEDEKQWKNKNFDNNSAVFITFRCFKANPSVVEIIFTYENVSSMVYSYKMCPMEQDAYFLINLPKKLFDEKRAVLMTSSEFYSQIVEEQMEKSLPFESSKCMICYQASAEMVFIPCGHCTFCERCLQRYKESACPNCKAERVETVKRRMFINLCMVCPIRKKCAQMNAILLPCCCVVGCMKTTKLAIELGDSCPNLECKLQVERIQQIYS